MYQSITRRLSLLLNFLFLGAFTLAVTYVMGMIKGGEEEKKHQKAATRTGGVLHDLSDKKQKL